MPSALRILLPLADRKKPGGRDGTCCDHKRLAARLAYKTIGAPRRAALDGFQKAMASGSDALKVLGLQGAAFREAYAVNRALERCNLATALERNNGAFADTLEPAALPPAAKTRLERAVLFVCPLLGVLAADDPIPDYRCPEGAKLPGIGSLHRHWKPEVTKLLNRLLKRKRVLSFLPTRLSALWAPDGGASEIVCVRFARYGGDRLTGETAATPGLVGEAVRYVIEKEVARPSELARFKSSLGHTYSAAHSETVGRLTVMRFVR
ncbi:MAG TPA: peroxide stress protein YaaA [Planctomycetota bacterium]|nr:peroxide stress protein YaaA [Planctomycetota bacterium]